MSTNRQTLRETKKYNDLNPKIHKTMSFADIEN